MTSITPPRALAGVFPAIVAMVAVGLAPAPAAAIPTPATRFGQLAASSTDARISSLLPRRMASSRLGGATGAVLAVEVRDARTHRLVFSRGGTSSLRGASTAKLFTSTVALQTMGGDHRLVTRVRLGTISRAGGVTSATVSLVAGGDPLLASSDLDALAQRAVTALRSRGVTKVSVTVDDTLFAPPTRPRGWPASYGLDVVRPVRALVRDGRMLTDVTTDAGRYFSARVAARGTAGGTTVQASFGGRLRLSPGRPTLASTPGHTVEQAVRQMLKVSDNQIAEMLFRLSALATGRTATWAGGQATAVSVLGRLGVPLDGVRIIDGSGASRDDRLTARALAIVLERAVNVRAHPALAPIYVGRAMPVAARSGSLAWRYSTAPSRCAAGKVVAKTGALHDVLSLSGVTVGADGHPKTFAILLENPPTDRYGGSEVRVAIDGLAATITGCW